MWDSCISEAIFSGLAIACCVSVRVITQNVAGCTSSGCGREVTWRCHVLFPACLEPIGWRKCVRSSLIILQDVHRAYTIMFPAKPMYACRFSFRMVAFSTPFVHVRECGGFAHVENNTCRDLSKRYPSVSARNALALDVLPVPVCVWGDSNYVTIHIQPRIHSYAANKHR